MRYDRVRFFFSFLFYSSKYRFYLNLDPAICSRRACTKPSYRPKEYQPNGILQESRHNSDGNIQDFIYIYICTGNDVNKANDSRNIVRRLRYCSVFTLSADTQKSLDTIVAFARPRRPFSFFRSPLLPGRFSPRDHVLPPPPTSYFLRSHFSLPSFLLCRPRPSPSKRHNVVVHSRCRRDVKNAYRLLPFFVVVVVVITANVDKSIENAQFRHLRMFIRRL